MFAKIRRNTDALHCGKRHYLHDDLETMRLETELVTSPPIILWPNITARVPFPVDVEAGLIAPLKE